MRNMFFVYLLIAGLFLLPAMTAAKTDDCKASCSVKNCGVMAKSEAPKLDCPVCGMKIENNQKASKLEHKGKTIYFMSEACKEAFVKEPGKFVKECCGEKDCFCCPKGCKQTAYEAGKCSKCGADMKKCDTIEKVACCQSTDDCKTKKKE